MQLFCFSLEIPILDKFGISTDSNMQNSVVVFIFSAYDREYPFLGKYSPKNQNYQFKVLEDFSRCSAKLIHFCKKLPPAMHCRQSKYYL